MNPNLNPEDVRVAISNQRHLNLYDIIIFVQQYPPVILTTGTEDSYERAMEWARHVIENQCWVNGDEPPDFLDRRH